MNRKKPINTGGALRKHNPMCSSVGCKLTMPLVVVILSSRMYIPHEMFNSRSISCIFILDDASFFNPYLSTSSLNDK